MNVGGIPDAKYFELKYYIQLSIAIFSILVTIFSAFGLTSLSDVKKELKTEIKRSIDSLENRLHILSSNANNIESYLKEVKANSLTLTK